MDRKLFGLFTGTQLTIMTCAAIVVPSALYATVTFTPVAITDPNTGTMTYVDAGRRVWTYNPIQGYTNNPGYLVNIQASGDAGSTGSTIYTVPTGKILLIKSITWSYYANTAGNNNSLYLHDGSFNLLMNFEGLSVAANTTADFPAPLVARAGAMTYAYSDSGVNSAFLVYIQGYLVPASIVPAPGSTDHAQQFVRLGKPPRAQ